MPAIVPSFERYFMAIERVERLLLGITGLLDTASIRYAVIGGNAVAAWVASKDPGATRATKDVDLLLERNDLARVGQAVQDTGYYLDTVGDVTVILERADPAPSRGVHIVFAGEKVRTSDPFATPMLDASVTSMAGFRVIDVASLFTMKLTAFRRHDQVHLEDMIGVGLLTPEVRAAIPAELYPRLIEIERTLPEWH